MPDTSKIDLIIFDTDGTIIPSLEIVYEGISKAFQSLGWEFNYTPEDINQYIGTASGEMYKNIIPPEQSHRWEELRDKSRAEYRSLFRKSAQTFPGVKETLTILRERGYKLVLYSNASTLYFSTVIESLDIQEYFDYAECVHDNDLTKPILVKKIKELFGNCPAAIVGDRENDVEAARETGSLSVGVLFGYGNDEPRQADFQIERFTDLLQIFDRRIPIFGKIESEIKKRKKTQRPFVLGVTGIDASGKTLFSKDLELFLLSKRYKTQMIHLDDFHNPTSVRYSGDNPADNYYNLSFNIDQIISKLLIPIRTITPYRVTLPILNLETDKYDLEKEYIFDADTIVIFEGVFLLRKELSPYIDYTVYLEISYEESLSRGQLRNTEDIVEKYATKYLAAQRKHLAEYPPEKHANLIVDNSNWGHPSTGK